LNHITNHTIAHWILMETGSVAIDLRKVK